MLRGAKFAKNVAYILYAETAHAKTALKVAAELPLFSGIAIDWFKPRTENDKPIIK
jgi:hypothetical protein